MNIKKKTPMLVGAITVLLIVIANAAYAYFSSSITVKDGATFKAIFTSTTPVLTAYTESDLALTIYNTDMQSSTDTSVKFDSAVIDVTFMSASDDDGVTCTYDIDLIWDSEDTYTPSGTLGSGDLASKTYELSLKGSRETDNSSSHSYANKEYAETNIDKLSFTTGADGKKRAKLITGADIFNQSSTDETTTTWTFTLSFYNLPISQNSLLGKTYRGHLEVGNINCG